MAKEKKTKKHDTFIDMTAMSDMTVLLLTFFMLTATFLPLEPVQVVAPSSVSETKIPESDILMILVDPSGKVFLNISGAENKARTLDLMGQRYNISFSDAERRTFQEDGTFAVVPMKDMKTYLGLQDMSKRTEMAAEGKGIPNDSINNELEWWVQYGKMGSDGKDNKNMTLSIKADQSTSFDKVDKVIKTLTRIKESRFSLITTLEE